MRWLPGRCGDLIVTWYVIVPSLKVSGGVREAMRLGTDVAQSGVDAALVCMWRTQRALPAELTVHQLSEGNPSAKGAILELPKLLLRFWRWIRGADVSASSSHFVFTHYATFPLALLVPRSRRFYFVQDLEWHFVHSGALAWTLRRIILYFYRRGRLLSANSYLTAALQEEGLPVELEVPIWASPDFLANAGEPRDIDYVMVLRKGAHKRLDLYLQFLDLARARPDLRVAVISPEDEIIDQVRNLAAVCLLRPTVGEMRALYSRSKCFVHLSDHEGFGLPPLEAMGAGCVPLCRDSGGVRAFMAVNPLRSLLMPLEWPIQAIFEKGRALIAGGDLQALSDAGKQIFSAGLHAANNRGSDLARLVRTTP
jgi:glycosyltransferase involved in cell wall biosynthesis